jgi:hypothetical protein
VDANQRQGYGVLTHPSVVENVYDLRFVNPDTACPYYDPIDPYCWHDDGMRAK